MKTRGTVAFDIIGTCFSLEKPRTQLVELGAPAYALQLWFSQTLRDAFALSLAGGYQPLKQVLEAQLPRTLKMLGVEASSVERSRIVSSFSQLELQSGALESFQLLSEAGWKLVALSNGSEDSTRQLLEHASVQQYFTDIFSCDTVGKSKPHPDVYAMPKRDAEGDVWMVAVHAWDIAGAAKASLRTAFITSQEQDYLSIYPQPELVISNLVEAASKIIESEVNVV